MGFGRWGIGWNWGLEFILGWRFWDVADVGYREAQKEVQNIALDNNFAIPGDPGFPLNQVCLSHRFISHLNLILEAG
jgi:hypothetical protein